VLGATVLFRPDALTAVGSLALPWLFSPVLAALVGWPLIGWRGSGPSEREERELRRLALRTWLFFERYLTSENHWLPPDNFQEDRDGAVARRTSPTNIGMMLAATLSAYDLGYVGPLVLQAICQNTLETLRRLERHRGHYLNWYATDDLRPLEPRYVSTVDSGNLAAALIVLRQGIRDVHRDPVLGPRLARGLEDTLRAARETVAEVREPELRELARPLRSRLDAMLSAVSRAAERPSSCARLLQGFAETELVALDVEVASLAEAEMAAQRLDLLPQLLEWAQKLHQHVGVLQRLCGTLHPWLHTLDDPPPALADLPRNGAGETWRALRETLSGPIPLDAVPLAAARGMRLLRRLEETVSDPALIPWALRLEDELHRGATAARRLTRDLDELAAEAEERVEEMDFGFLFDRRRGLFHIGFDVTREEADPNYYDLLASEARLASYLAIAKGDVPAEHWLRLGRPFGLLGDGPVLLSWGATMFEYLLPALFLSTPSYSLLGRSCRAAVRQQRRFARRHGVPWGISESGFHQIGGDASYQYRAFGVPELGLRRDLGDRLVIAPYASLLALTLAPKAVLRNVKRLDAFGMSGPTGLYEAIDFGAPSRRNGARPRIVRSYMAHHQGMILAAVGNRLGARTMQDRFHSDPRVSTYEHLLHERTPWRVPVRQSWTDGGRARIPELPPGPPHVRPWTVSETSPLPEALLLSNESLSVLVTGRGGGGARWRGTAVTRWSPDPTLDDGGTWIYVRDLDRGDLWSAGAAPVGTDAGKGHVLFAPHLAEFRRRHGGIALRMRVAVAPDDDVEIRLVTLANEDTAPRRLVVASCAEPVLEPLPAFERHPAFSRLFVRTAWLPEERVLLAWRRRRSPEERVAFVGHTLVAPEGLDVSRLEFETDRLRFLGRWGSWRRPAALQGPWVKLSGVDGMPLDPVLALACPVDLAPGEEVELAFLTAVGESKPKVLRDLEFFSSMHHVSEAIRLSRQRAELDLHEIGIAPDDVQSLQTLLSLALHPCGPFRARPDVLVRWDRPQPELWKYGVSGDDPIVLVEVEDAGEMRLVEELLRAHRYWRARGLRVDLVILDLVSSGYARPMRDRLSKAVDEAAGGPWIGLPGGIHLIGAESCPDPDRTMLESVARVILRGERGDLAARFEGLRRPPVRLPPFVPVTSGEIRREAARQPRRREALMFFNGIGGFSPDGREYVMRVRSGRPPPAPWAQVLASPTFGCLVTEAGLGSTWSMHASENRLTPWGNDPVRDPPSEALYLRDEETAEVWSPTPLPAGPPGPIEVRHAAGASVYGSETRGLRQTLEVTCASDAPLKLVRLRLENRLARPRRITATYYAEWVLGALRSAEAHHVVRTTIRVRGDPRALLPSGGFGERVAFLSAACLPTDFTSIGRSSWAKGAIRPARRPGAHRALRRRRPGPRPLRRIHGASRHRARRAKEAWFLLGQGRTGRPPLSRSAPGRSPGRRGRATRTEELGGRGSSGTVQVETPEPEFDLLAQPVAPLPGALLPPLGALALYQSSGAFGFRDQLQDVLALLHAAPRWPGSRSSTPRATSSSRATCSTGGTRRATAACGPAARTTCSGSPGRWPSTSGPPETPRSSMRRCPTWAAPSWSPGRTSATTNTRRAAARGASTTTACGPWSAAPRRAATACR
jgi:cyclic beta-1,2-glucan synthetase